MQGNRIIPQELHVRFLKHHSGALEVMSIHGTESPKSRPWVSPRAGIRRPVGAMEPSAFPETNHIFTTRLRHQKILPKVVQLLANRSSYFVESRLNAIPLRENGQQCSVS